MREREREMNDYTVTITVGPVTDEAGWDKLRGVLDSVPGTVLFEYPDAPELMFRVPASDPFSAARFVDGVTKLLDIAPLTGEIELADDDFAEDAAPRSEEAGPTTEVVQRAMKFAAETGLVST
jgi:hypothetical protein